MEILILGDSIPFGRPKYGICRDRTWPYILRRELDTLLCMRAFGGSTSSDVLAEARSLTDYWFGSLSTRRFDAAFVQVGIVDASPRLVPKLLYPFASKAPGFSRLQRSKWLHKVIGRPWVSSSQFILNISKIDSLLCRLADQVFFVEIAMPSHFLKDNVGDFSDSIRCRNDLISQCVGEAHFVSCWGGEPVPQYLLPDGHHLNEEGHKVVAKQCFEMIS
jgi:hypothetical protein